jgi:hypothetical protein
MVQPQWLHEMHGCVVEAEITCMLRGIHRWKQFIGVGAARSVVSVQAVESVGRRDGQQLGEQLQG